ncbi:hypothetical protein OG298_38280 [Streptomyces sp. NBC_01005]|uniref:hypothetical protein n=1 Tax=unclassified Streptomyces TaxID=2593676 RepID=UPI002E3323E7|nr:hypothetical protein [Streptomyces sp. NBC_01362]WSW09753.1 hypothetical protein OG298_38280 [Streptomyces sp. NBC_01005]WTC99262.1 hypothetical protein OH736_38295 [Streptomyces sp. NBC_01650]
MGGHQWTDALGQSHAAVAGAEFDLVISLFTRPCNAGYNRSGLVVAQILIELGRPAKTAIQLIRERRSPWALNNQMFEEYLTTGLDVASLPVGLGHH